MPWKPLVNQPSDAEVRAAERERPKFLVDQGLDDSVAEVLDELGWKAVWVDALATTRPSKSALLAYARKHELVILTHDRELLEDAEAPPQDHPGIIVLPGDRGDGTALRRGLAVTDWLFGPYRDAWRRFKCDISSEGVMEIRMRHADTGELTTGRYRFTTSWPPLECLDDG